MQSLENQHIEIIYKNNLPFNIKINHKFLHSYYDPIKEAERQFSHWIKNISQQVSTILCYKVGIGYIVEQILKHTNFNILWIEPEEIILQKAIERLSVVFNEFHQNYSKRISFIPSLNIEFIHSLKKNILSYELFYLKNAINKEDLILIDLFYRKRFYYQVNYHTAKKFEKIWVSNFYKNLIFINKFLSINYLNNIYKNYSSFIVCGGPSLDKWINSIKQYQDQTVIICVDTALNTLIYHNIIPDFVISIDAQAINYLHLEKHLDKPFHLVCDPVVYYLTIKNYTKYFSNVFVFNNTLPYVSYIYKKLFPDISFLKSGGSVSTSALDFANYLGCSNIFFVGLDFGFPNRVIHTKFSSIESRMIYFSNRLNSLENYNYKQIISAPKKICLNLKNHPVITNDKLLIFKKWFEKNYINYQHLNLYLLYGDGCYIDKFKIIQNEDELFKSIIPFKKNKLNISYKNHHDVKKILETNKNKFIYFIEKINYILHTIEDIQKKVKIEILDLQVLSKLENELFLEEELNMFPLLELPKEHNEIKENLEITKEIYLSLKEHILLHLRYLSKSLVILQRLE
jgi:hypothetical protein